jgi:hypothetical protein
MTRRDCYNHLKSQHQAKRGLPVYKNGIDENMTFFSLKSGWPDEFEKMTPKMLPKPSFVKSNTQVLPRKKTFQKVN